MTKIRVEACGDDAYRVTVSDTGSETVHEVSVSEEERAGFGGDAVAQDLLRESFRFLLEREPKESILPRFELSAIQRYFPEYRDEMRRRLG
jgi:hypothetical protein